MLTVWSSPLLILYELGEYRCPPGCDGHYHHSRGSACVNLHMHTDGASPGHVSVSGQVAASCSCRLLSHQTLLWHHSLGHPSLPRLHGMHSCLLVSGLPRSLPPLPPSPAPPCLPCVEGRQRATPHSSSFPPTTAPLHTLHMDMWGPAHVNGQGRERYFLLVVDVYTRYTTVFPLRSKGEVSDVLIPWMRTVRLQLHERFGQDLPVLHLQSDRGGEFLPTSYATSVVGREFSIMEVARTSIIHVVAPHFLWPFAVRYAAHQLNLWPRVSLPETLPTLRWTGEVGDASVFRVWGYRAFVRDTSVYKLSARAIPCVFLGFVPDAPGWQFYHPTLPSVFPSQDIMFDEPFPFYRLFPYRSAPPLPPPLFLAPGPPLVDPLPPQGLPPSGVSQVDPLSGTMPLQVAVGSGAAPGAASGGAEPGGAESEGAGSGGAGPGGEEPRGAEPAGVETGGVEPGGAESEGAESGGAEPRGAASSGGPAGASPQLSPQQLREWFARRPHLRSGATGAGDIGDARAGGAGVTAGAGGAGAAATGPGGARTRGSGAARSGGVEGAGAGDPTELGATRAGGCGAGGAGAAGARAVDPGAGGGGDIVRPRPYFVPLLHQVLGVQSSTTLTPPLLCPPPDQSQLPLQLASPLPAPSPYTEQSSKYRVSPLFLRSLTLRLTVLVLPVPLSLISLPLLSLNPSFESAAASALVAELLDFTATCRLDYATALLAKSESASPPSVGVRYASHQLNLWPHVSLPETSPTLRWTGEVGDVSVFRDVTFDESVPFYHLFPYRSAPPPPPPLFLALGPPPVDPLPGTVPVEVAVNSGAARGAASGGAASGLVSELVDFAAACRLNYATPLVAESSSASPPSVGGECALSTNVHEDRHEDLECLAAAVPHFASMLLAPEGDPDAPDIPSPRSYAEAITGPYSSQWQTAMDAEMASWKSTGTCVCREGAGDPAEPGAGDIGTVGAGAGGPGAGGAGAGGAGAGDSGAVVRRAGGARAGGAVSGGTGSRGTVQLRPYFIPMLQQPASALPAPSPYTEQTEGLTEHCEPVSRPASPVPAVCTSRRVPRAHPPLVPGTHAMALRPSSVPLRVPLPPPPASSLPVILDPESDLARAASPAVSRLLATIVTDPSFESTVASALVYELVDFAAACRLDYATALVAESESANPPSVGGECALGTDVLEDSHGRRDGILEVYRHLRRCISPDWGEHTQRDYKLHSLEFSTTFLQGSLHEEIWLRRPPGFTGTFPAGTQSSLRRPVYGLRQAPREWHDTLRTTLAAVGFTRSTADPSQFLRTDTSLPPFYVLVYVDDLFDTWLDDLQLYLLSDIEDSVSLFDHVSGAATAPPATADSSTRSQWLSRNAAARLAIRNHLLLAECAHFGKHRTAQALYDAEVARYSSPATAALGRLLMPYLFPELSAFATVKDLVLLVALPRPPFFEGCSPSPLASSYASAADDADVSVAEDVGTASTSAKCRSRKGKGGRGGGGSSGGGEGGSGSGGGGSSGGGGGGGTGGGCGGSGGGGGGSGGSGSSGGGGTGVGGTGAWRVGSGGGQRQQQQCRSKTQSPQQLREWFLQRGASGDLLRSRIAIFDLEFDAIHSAMYALSVSAEGDCYRCAPPDPGIAAASLGASESRTLPGSSPAQALHNFTLDSGASRCFFRDSTTLTPLPALVTVRLADPSWGPVVARSSTILLCPAVPSGSLSGLHLPSFSMNLVSTAALQDAMVTTTTPGGQCVSICTCTRTGRHLATFNRRPGSTLSLPPLPPTTAPPCLPCVEGRQRAAPLSSSFPPMTSPLQTLHMDLWSPARVSGKGRERYFLLVVDDYTRYTTVFPLRSKGEVSDVLIPWICTVRLQLHERFGQDLPVLHLHADRGGELSFDLLREFCRGEGILQSFTLPDSPQQNVIDERRIGLVMEVARTSMIHAAAPHFLWPFAVRYAAHQLNLWPSVSLPETSPTLRWTGKVGDALVFRVWGSRAFARDTSADKLSARAIPYIFLSFVLDVPGWQFYHPTSRRVFPSQDATFDEPVPSQGPAPSCVSQVDPLPSTALVQVVVGSGATPGTASGGAASGSAEPGVAESEGAGSGGAGPGAEEPGGAEPAGVETRGIEPGGAESEGAESGGAEPRGAASSGGPAGASSPTGAGDAGDAGAWGGGVTVGASGAGAAASCPGGARTRGTGAAWAGGVEGAGAGDPTEPGATRAGGSGTGAGGARAAGAGAVDPGAGGAGDTVRSRPYFVPLLQQVLGVPSSTSLTPPLLYPPHDQSQLPLQPASPPPAPSLYTQQSGGLTERRKPASRPVSPVRTTCCAPRSRPPPVLGKHAMVSRASSVPMRVPLPAHAASPTVSGLLATAVTDPSFESAAASALEDFEGLAAALPRFVSILLAPEGDPDAPDIPTPRSYAEAITSPYSSQWQATMDAEMASWKSTGTYVDEVPPPGTNITATGGRLLPDLFPHPKDDYSSGAAARRCSAPLRGALSGLQHSYPAGQPARGDLAAPPSWLHWVVSCRYSVEPPAASLRSPLGASRVARHTEDYSCGSWVLQRFGFHFSSPQPTPLSTSHSLSAPPLDKSSGLYPELVGCLIYLMTCTRPDLTYPLSLMARYVAPGRHRKVHWDAAKRVLCYLCSTLGMGLVLGGRGPFVLTGHEYAFWLNLWPRVSLPETSPTLRWTGEVGDASVFRVRGSLDFVRDTSADKLSPRAIPCLSRFPFTVSSPPLPPPLFLALGPPPVDPLPPQGPAPSGVSQVDPLLGPAPVQVAVDSRAARGAVSGGVASGGAEPGGARSEGAGSGGAEPGGVEIGGAELGGVATGGVEPGGAELEGVEPGGAASEGAASGDAEPQGATSSGGSACSSPSLSLQQLREWFVRRGASRAGGSGPAGAGGTGVAGGAGVTGGTAITGPGGARTWGTVAAGTGGVEGAGAGDLKESGTTGAGGAGAGGAGVGGPGAGGAGVGSPGVGGAGDGGAGAVDPGDAVRPRPYFVPLLQQPASPLPAPSPYTEQSDGLSERREPASRPISPVRTAHHVPRSRPPPVPGTHAMTLRPSSVPLRIPLPAPPQSSLLEVPDPESDRARAAHPAVSRLLATAFNDPSFESAAASALVAELLDFAAACRLDYATTLVAESASASPPSVRGECALGTDVLEDRQQDFECLAAAVPRFASMLLAPEGDPDAPDIPTLCSYAEAITSPYSS
ncbi:unnamed protein product [Closterium sp. NIES-54]